jgi:Glu-tRNA(Gln) amidotransferase subunit E-like FAD-binding protein
MSNLWSSRKVTNRSIMSRSGEELYPQADIPNPQIAIDKVEKRNGILQRLFPDETRRAVVQGELSLVKAEFEFRKKVLCVIRETQLQALQENCNQFLARGKATVRAETAKFILAEFHKLQQDMDDIYEEFMSEIAKKWTEAENTESEYLRNIKEGKIDRDLERFAEIYEQLVTRFQNLLNEGV